MKNDKIQNGRHLFYKKIINFVILPVTIAFFHLTQYRNKGHQVKLGLYLIKTLHYMENDKNTKWPPSV